MKISIDIGKSFIIMVTMVEALGFNATDIWGTPEY